MVSAAISQTLSNVVALSLSNAATLDVDDFTIDTDGAALNLTVVIGGNGTSTPQLALDRQIEPGEAVTLTYTGSDMSTFTSWDITNNVHIFVVNDFPGNLEDTSRGQIVNPNVANLSITYVTGVLKFLRVTSSNIGLGNYLRVRRKNGTYLFPYCTFASYMNRVSGYTNSVWMLRIVGNSSTDYAQFYNAGAGAISANIVQGGVLKYTISSGLTMGTYMLKIVYRANKDILFYYWNSSAWVQVGVTQNYDIGSSVECRAESTSSTSDVVNHNFTHAYMRVSDQDYSTVLPEDSFS